MAAHLLDEINLVVQPILNVSVTKQKMAKTKIVRRVSGVQVHVCRECRPTANITPAGSVAPAASGGIAA